MSQWARNNPELCREQFVREWLNKTPNREESEFYEEDFTDTSGLENIERHDASEQREGAE